MEMSNNHDHDIILSSTDWNQWFKNTHSSVPHSHHFNIFQILSDLFDAENGSLCAHRYPGSLTFCSGGTHGYDNDAESMHVSTEDSYTILFY